MWLVESKLRARLDSFDASQITADQIEAFSGLEIGAQLRSSGDTATIQIHGVLTKQPCVMSMMMGLSQRSYGSLIDAIGEADANKKIKKIVLDVDSPGGEFDGLFSLLDAIKFTETPIEAVVSGVAASAAYAVVSQADKISLVNRSCRVGSVGVVATIGTSSNYVEITSTNAPNKRPDVHTAEGIAAVKTELDQMHDLFVTAIAEGRGVTAELVNEKYGRGGTFLAKEALNAGMIDAILDENQPVITKNKLNIEAKNMDLDELKAAHPAVFAAAVKEGVEIERDRVSAHLTMGDASGDMTTALSAVKDGTGMTASLQATYMAAGMRKGQIDARSADDSEASDSVDAATPKIDASESSQVINAVISQMGGTL